MRSTTCVYVDAGYLLASAATRTTGTSLRSGINVDYPKLIGALIDTAADLSGLPLLRVHWYDSAQNGVPDARQERIGELPKVKLRLGRFGMGGEQKGVDLRIGLDLVNHARNEVSDVFYLVSGDDDLTEAVEEAQVHGVQVVVLAIPNTDGRPHGISRHLLRAVDEMHVLEGDLIDSAVIKIERQALPSAGSESAARSVPTPAAVAARSVPAKPGLRATPGTMPTQARVARPSATLAYSSVTGQEGRTTPGYDVDDNLAMIDGIADRVLGSFLDAASPDDIQRLGVSRPSIPSDIDRALLLDAVDALDIDDIPESIRHTLRSSFWGRFDKAIRP